MSEYDTISRSDQSECKALLDACTPLVYVHNAFRISGLAVDASARDIKRRIDDLKHAEELGDAEAEHTHAFALEPPPTLEHIREAAHRLQDPERRIIEEFFWFWPDEWGGGRADPSLTALLNGDKDTAFKMWSASLSNGNGSSPVVAKHNLAVMYQLVALDSEKYALEGDLSPDQLQTIAKYWRTSFKWWEDLTTDEMFWSLVTDRIRMLDDPRLTTGFARRMRTTLPEALDKINAMLAVAFFEKGKLDLGRNHVTYMLETHQGLDDVPKTLAIVTKPLKTRVESSVEKARTAAQREPKRAVQSARDLLNAVAEPIKIIQMILPANNHERIDLCDSVAETCLTCQIAFARETKDWATSLQILDSAKAYAASQETKARIEENRITVANNRLFAQYLDPLAAAIQKADTHPSVSAKLKAVESDVVPRLRAIDQQAGITAEVSNECADLVARYVRNLSVTAFNENTDMELAARAHDLARSLARGSDLKRQLQEDAAQLGDIRFTAKLRQLVESSAPSDYTLTSLQNAIAQKLQSLSPGQMMDQCLEAAAYALRAFAIKVSNENKKYSLGQQAIDAALGYANRMKRRNAELVSQLMKDKVTVSMNREVARQNTVNSVLNFPGVSQLIGIGILLLIVFLLSLAGC